MENLFMNGTLSDNSTVSKDETVRVLAQLWREVLQTPALPGEADNFFALGGDSMMMTMLEFRIGEELSVELPPGAVLNAPSLRELAALVQTSRGAAR
jgi:acyl carrier protein